MKRWITAIACAAVIVGGAIKAEAGMPGQTIKCPPKVRGTLGMVKYFTPPPGWGKYDIPYGGYELDMPLVDHWISNNKMVCAYGVQAIGSMSKYGILRITKQVPHGMTCRKAANFSFQCSFGVKPNLPNNIPRPR